MLQSRAFGFSRLAIDKLIQKTLSQHPDGLLLEHEVHSILGDLGFAIPSHAYSPQGTDPASTSSRINADVLLAKGVVRTRKDGVLVTHKTDIGAIQFNIPNTPDGIRAATKRFEDRFHSGSPYDLQGILFTKQLNFPGDFGTEMIVSAYQDPFFGPTVCYGFGGTGVDFLRDLMAGQAELFMPAFFSNPRAYETALSHLPVAQFAEGKVRGTKPHLDHSTLVSALKNLRDLMSDYSQYNKTAKYVIEELEVNPTIAIDKQMWACDGVMRVRERGSSPYLSPTTCGKPLHRVKCLLHPQSVIVAGASAKNAKNPGSVIINHARDSQVKEIYAVHPTSKALFGFPAYPNLTQILRARNGAPVDLLSVCVPAQSAGKLVAESLKTFAAHAIQVISGGFGETEKGAQMQDDLRAQLFAMPTGVRPVVNGPNTVGNLADGGINTVFVDHTRSTSDWKTGKRNCALFCQSGAFMLSRVSDLAPAIVPSVAISVGNQLDLSVTDFFEYYLESRDLTTFALYIEGLSEGEGIRLMNLVKRARDLGKAVVIYKAGRTQAGLRAAKGHTASMAGDFLMFRRLLEIAGALVVDSFEDWNQILTITTLFPELQRRRSRSVGVAVVTNAGFEKCATADHLMTKQMEKVLHLPKWSDETVAELNRIFRKYKIDEVVDVGEVLDVTPMVNDPGYYEIMKVAMRDRECDIGLMSCVPESTTLLTEEYQLGNPKSLLQYAKKLREEFPGKPLITVIESGQKYYPLRRELNKIGVPSFPSIDSAARALAMVIRQANRE